MFTQEQKLKALGITHIFESIPATPFGNADTVVVLNDKAGITYGISQCTHASGNLYDVVRRYLEFGSNVLRYSYFTNMLPTLKKTSRAITKQCEENIELKRYLREIGTTKEMRKAQLANMNSRLQKAINACEGSDFTSTLALAVIYDSINHGSWEKIRDNVSPNQGELSWITEYVNNRDKWLESIPRLKNTSYRTDFFKTQIKAKNWNLELPLNVHGFRLTDAHIEKAKTLLDVQVDNVKPFVNEDKVVDNENKDEDEAVDNEQPNEPVSTVLDAVTGDEVPKTQTVEAKTTNEQIGETTEVKTQTENQTETENVEIKKERPSLYSKAMAGVSFVTGAFIFAKNFIYETFNSIEQVPTTNIVIICLTGLACFAIGAYFYDRSAQRSNVLNQQNAETAKNPLFNNVQFKG